MLVIFTPDGPLDPRTDYTLLITVGIKSTDGIPLSQPHSSSFTIAGFPDTTSPMVAVIPKDGDVEVPVNTAIVFVFSEPINPLTVNSSTITVTNNGTPLAGSITLSHGNTVGVFTMTPYANFLPNSQVVVTLSQKVNDTSGNTIIGNMGGGTDFVSRFTTASRSDFEAPRLLSINPPDGATKIDPDTKVSVTFSEPVNPVTVNSGTFTISVDGAPYPGLISFSIQNTVATFTPDQPFPTNSLVTVTLSAGISDVAGNRISSPFSSTFTTYEKGPVLTIGYSGATSLTIGDTINVEIANAGDIDTTSTYLVKLSDANEVVIYQNSIIELIPTGTSKIYSFQIPSQAANSNYLLYAEATDSKNNKTTASFNLKIIGLTATINARTNKESYLGSESVTGISSIVNGPFGFEGGSLKASVTEVGLTSTGGFKVFVPKNWTEHSFNRPIGIALGSDGSLYVVNSGSHEIQKFDGDGNFITKWGSYGGGDAQFHWPSHVAVGSDGSVYVSDSGNNRIQKFDSSGNFITKWGTFGIGDGQFYYPVGIAVGPEGSVYVASDWRIQKFDNNGNFVTKWGSYGTGDGQFDWPFGIAVGRDGAVYVTDKNNHRIQKFGPNGDFIGRWGAYGSGDGQFDRPSGIAVGPDSSVYVTDEFNNRIQKFDRDGNFIMKWGNEGTEDGQFSWPEGVSIGSDGSVYMADTFNERIQPFDSSGTFIAKWGSVGSGDGQFILPMGIALAPDGSVYVSDYYNHRIQKMIGEDVIQTIYETTLPIQQATNFTQDYTINIGALNVTAKFNLQATLTNSLGQIIAQSSYPFYVFLEDIVLLFNTDKKVCNPGETIAITGRVENRGATDATNLVLTLNSKPLGQNSQSLYTDTFDLPSGGSHSFTLTTSAGAAAGTVILTGTVSQGGSTLVEIKDKYEVVNP